jgi:hypothetical protein
MRSRCEQLRIGFDIQQNFPGDDFGISKIEVMQACVNKFQNLVVRRIGAFAVLKYHHSDADAFAAVEYIIRPESVGCPEDLTDTAFGAAGSIRNRTNLGELSNEYVHQALRASQFQTNGSKHIGSRPADGRLPRQVIRDRHDHRQLEFNHRD